MCAVQFLKTFKEISKKNFTYWFILLTLTFSCSPVFKEVSLPSRVPVHTLVFLKIIS